MYEKLRNHILPRLIPHNAKVLVAVSGGPDSIALCHILWRYLRESGSSGISLVLTHVHHGVRKESDQEVEFVQQMAERWDIPCLIHRFDAKTYAKTMGLSFQEAAREWRYSRWKEDMLNEGCTLLATAHHLGDQAETILYRLLRGSGTAGLAGIYPAKNSIIRPLLTFPKSDILNYCAQETLPYALDRSNEEPVYVRNRIRLELLPELEKNYNPRIQEALGRMGELLRWDEEYFTQQLDLAWNRYHLFEPLGSVGLKREVFTEPAALLSRLLRRAAMLASGEHRGLAFAFIELIIKSTGKPGWRQNLPGMVVSITEKGIWFCSNSVDLEKSSHQEENHGQSMMGLTFPERILEIGYWLKIPSMKVEIGLMKEENLVAENSELVQVAVFSSDLLTKFPGPLVCRIRLQGDKMWFNGVGHKSLKKVFQEAGISANVRKELLVIAHESEVLWIPGVRESDLCLPDHASERVYCILKPQVRSNLNSL